MMGNFLQLENVVFLPDIYGSFAGIPDCGLEAMIHCQEY